jgi:murein DD-endopeptidase MepM/ murein hydrolase activator NlpD
MALSEYWNGRNEVFVKSFQTLNDLGVDGKAGEQTFSTLDPRSWPLRDLVDGRQCFVTNGFDPVKHKGIDVFWWWQDGDQLIKGYYTPYGGGRVWYPYGTMATAAEDGVIARSELISTGWLVTINHVTGDSTGYFHGIPQTAVVNVGDTVERGQQLFYCGWDRSLSSEPTENNPIHLHFSVQRNGAYMDPEDWLRYASYLPAYRLVSPENIP